MKVLHCIPTMTGGGAERQLALLASAQVARGHEVHLVSLAVGPHAAAATAAGVTVHQLSVSSSYDTRMLGMLRRLIRTLRPTLIQTWLTQMDVAGGIVARMTGTPWLLSERTSGVFFRGTVKGWLRRTIATGGVDAVVANSPDGADYWKAYLGDRRPIVVINNAVPRDRIEASVPLDRSASRPLVLFAGRFSAEKNALAVVRALVLASREVEFDAWLCGEGPQEGAIRQLVAESQLQERITLMGYRQDLWSLMKSASLFVSLSHFEGQPNAVLEAMSCGCPVLLSDIPPHRDLIADQGGWLVPADEPEMTARAMVEALRNPAEARVRADRAREKMVSFTPDACARAYESVYASMLGGRQ